MMKAILAGAALAALPALAHADAWPEAAREAAAAYAEGRFGDAAEGYESVVIAGETRPEIVYNLGAARYRAADGDSAALAAALADFRRAAVRGDAGFRPRAIYNGANMQALLGDLEAAAEGYKDALRQNPADDDARYNLELVQRMMREQQSETQKPQPGGEEPNDSEDESDEQNQSPGEQPPDEPPPPGEQPPRENEEPPGDDDAPGQPPESPPPGDPGEQPPPAGGDSPTEPPPAPAGGISPEEARRQLDKLEEAERELLRQLLLQQQRRADVEKDW